MSPSLSIDWSATIGPALHRCYRDVADPGARAWIVPLHVQALHCAMQGQADKAANVREQLARMCAGRHIDATLIATIERRAMTEMAESPVEH